MNLSDCFLPGEILLPRVNDLEKWSVIACDQFTADPAYWARVSAFVGDAPSTLRLMLPEAWLDLPWEDFLARLVTLSDASRYGFTPEDLRSKAGLKEFFGFS